MRASILWAAWAFGLTAGLVLFTLHSPFMGMGLLPYNTAFVLTLVAAVATWPVLLRRRVASLGLAVTGTLAIATGFLLLYGHGFLRIHRILFTMKFWHVLVSVAMLPFFAAHFVRNRVRLTQFLGRILARRVTAAAYAGGWAGLLLWAGATWWPPAAATITAEAYRPLVDGTWLATFVVVGAVWLVGRYVVPRVTRSFVRNDRRAFVDATILGTLVLVVVTGFLLVYVQDGLRDAGLWHVGLFWHTAPSVVFLVLLTVHVGANLRVLVAHARRVVDEVDGERPRRERDEGSKM